MRKVVAALFVVGVCGAVAGWVVSRPGSQEKVVVSPAPPSTADVSGTKVAASLDVPPRAADAPPSQAVVAAPPESKATRLRRLADSKDPKQAYQAYQVLAECVFARDAAKELLQTPSNQRQAGALEAADARKVQVCEDLQDADLVVQKRLTLLTTAAEAGVYGAAVRLAGLGPFGDISNLYTRPDDLLVREWGRRMTELITKAAETKDPEALMSLANQYAYGGGVANERNHAKALMYMFALRTINEREGKSVRNTDVLLSRYRRSLKPEEVAEAERAGLEIANRARQGG
jgi:hypothetical protein